MNGLALRISKAGGKKTKNGPIFTHVDVSQFITESTVVKNVLLSQFLKSNSTDEQLVALKRIFDQLIDENLDEDTVNFLVAVFFQAEVKHPAKCFVIRHITKNPMLQDVFSEALSIQMCTMVSGLYTSYKEYVDVVSKLATCMENFPAGARALKMQGTKLINYLDCCLKCCIETLQITKSLSPTEKNEIFNLAHLALRLLLHLYSHYILNENSVSCRIGSIKESIQALMFDEDVPMDTKSVCGILFLTLLRLEEGTEAWMNVLKTDTKNDSIKLLLSNEASRLSLYAAIATVVAVDTLQCRIVDGAIALQILTENILEIGEKCSSESIFVLGVTRTLLQISKSLGKVKDNSLGLSLVENLLTYVWTHLEHYMDSVRHLTVQILSYIVKYCSRLDKEGDSKALSNLFSALTSLDRSRKSYYVSLTCLISDIGAREIIRRLPTVISEVVTALSGQAVQASATTTLETLLQRHAKECNTDTIYQEWIEPILQHVASNSLDSGVLNILDNLLTNAVKFDENVIHLILPHINKSSDLKCILMLVSVVRKSGVASNEASGDWKSGGTSEGAGDWKWKGILGYEVLDGAIVAASEEIRILSLSLIVESLKTSEIFTKGELTFVLKFLKYNINTQSPNFRQLNLSMMKKFIKRLEDSHRVLKRQKDLKEDFYLQFVEDLRALCFDSLIPGANYSRRTVALQVLMWTEMIYLDGYQRIWKETYVDKLLLHLEDSYENNKEFSLHILNKCPVELLTCKRYSISLDIEDILRQASSMKPTDCISAAYKLDLLRSQLPDSVIQGKSSDTSEPITYALLLRLHTIVCREQEICERSIINAAVNAPMYGALHCMVHCMASLDVDSISSDQRWNTLVNEIISTCIRVNAAVECVVNNSSPEGHLPMDMGGVRDHGNESGIRLEDGRQVTAQMVLLCAWRSVKEVSLLLGEISSRLSIAGEGVAHGTLAASHLLLIGEHFTKLLAETKHRGAFEQAYVGFTKLLARLWRCRNPLLHELPRAWLSQLTAAIASGDKRASLCATRRSAGLPFMIQALVTTELQVQGNPKCFHECMSTLLRLARTPPLPSQPTEMAIETRTHSINILRALFRNSALDESVSGYVGEGLVVALEGFEGDTWMERNSSTLLFSALVVRVFGVARSKRGARNKMTGRVFFLRYPRLYDYMLNKLKEVSVEDNGRVLRPSLYPILLLLARLYPSSLEGTVSNLKLIAFIPHVLSAAKSGVLKTRQLAAKAMVPLISPDQYLQHLEEMFTLICSKDIKKNYCHGILLQLIRLLDAKPESLSIESEAGAKLSNVIKKTFWILQQALGGTPCWLLADDYVKVINLLIWRFPSLMHHDTMVTVSNHLDKMLFHDSVTFITSGKDICLANALYLYLIIFLNIQTNTDHIVKTLCNSLNHNSYEVIVATLNYILILNDSFDFENKFEEHIAVISNKDVLNELNGESKYIETLCHVLNNNKYLECTQKTLKVLSLKDGTERLMIEKKIASKEINDENVIKTLFDCIQNEHENLTHIYLETLSKFTNKLLKNATTKSNVILEVIRMFFACSCSNNNDTTRDVVVSFLENNCEELFRLKLEELDDEDKFEYKATLYATLVTVLEDENYELRQKTSNVITVLNAANIQTKVIPSRSAELLRTMVEKEVHSAALFVVLALLDFKSEVCMNDDVNDECRVFDQNERYNMFCEETIWSRECADNIIQLCAGTHTNPVTFIQNIIQNPIYNGIIKKLSNNNYNLFEKILKGESFDISGMNPKIKLFSDKLLEA